MNSQQRLGRAKVNMDMPLAGNQIEPGRMEREGRLGTGKQLNRAGQSRKEGTRRWWAERWDQGRRTREEGRP